jgi:hypothetical protein
MPYEASKTFWKAAFAFGAVVVSEFLAWVAQLPPGETVAVGVAVLVAVRDYWKHRAE